MRALQPFVIALFLGLSLTGCPEKETSTSTGSASGTPTDPAMAPASSTASSPAPAMSAAATPSADPSAMAATSATAMASAKTPAGAGKVVPAASATAAAITVDAGPTCGVKPLPDCPLQSWMKANTAIASASGDLPSLAVALDKIAGMAPPGYANWASISKDGATAAKAGNLDASRASCTGCHKQYRDKYRAEIRTRAVP